MSFFDDIDAQHSQFFVDPDLMGGELVTYCPLAGVQREINAIVTRSPNREVDGVFFCDVMLTVRNDATSGISLEEYNKGGDVVIVAKRKGGETSRLRITGDPITQDGGVLTFKVA